MKSFEHSDRILFIIFLTVFLNMLGVGIIIPVIAPMMLDPSYPMLPSEVEFSTRTILIGFLIASFPLAQFFGSPLLGAWSDRAGRKKILLIALAGTLGGYLLFIAGVLLNFLPLLFLGRILDGITGGNVSIIYSAIADVSNQKAKTKNFGLVGTAFGLGFIVGPFLGGILSDPEIISWFDYWTPFALASVLIMINSVLVIYWFPETLKNPVYKPINLTQGVRNVYKALTLGKIKSMLIVIFLVTFGFTFFTQFFQVFLIEKFDFRQSDIGKLFAYIGIWITITQGVLTRITSYYFTSARILYFSICGLSISFLLLLIPDNSYYFYFILPLLSISQGLNQPNLLSVLSGLADDDDQGEILGVNQSLQSLAFAIPPIIAGFLATIDVNIPMLCASFSVFCGLLVYVLSVPGRNIREATDASETLG